MSHAPYVKVGAFDLAWPGTRLGEAFATLAERAKLVPEAGIDAVPSPAAADLERLDVGSLDRWFRQSGDALGIETQLVSVPYAEVDGLALRAPPAMVRLKSPTTSEFRYLAMVRAERGRLVVVTPELEERAIDAGAVRSARFARFEQEVDATILSVLGAFGVRASTSEARAQRLRAEFNAGATLSTCWLLAATPGGSWRRAARADGLFGAAAKLFGVQLALASATLFAWGVLGTSALAGRSDKGWLVAWALLVLTEVPLVVHSERLQGTLSLDLSKRFKQRLLWGAGHLDPGEVRSQGSGALLARVFEAEAVEALALDNGFALFGIASNVILAPVVLANGAAGLRHVIAFVVALFLVGILSCLYLRARARWTDSRLALTGDLVERMLGHRTRVAQEPRAHWHDGEDERLASYVARSRPMDLLRAALVHAPRVWLALALLLLAPALVTGAPTPALAASLGGIALVAVTLQQLASAAIGLSGAGVALRSVLPMLRAGGSQGGAHRTRAALAPIPAAVSGELVLDASDVAFQYPGRSKPVLTGCTLRICAGERVLIEGPSGGGKTTLASLLCGLHTPTSGLLLFRGVDRATLGERGWRERVALVPQFHENHVFAGSLAFNLLLGRRWPAEPKDLADAEDRCRDLGLGPLLDAMPRGIQEIVGDAGWQLSHGERSRVFLARALLQDADVVIVDESFGALDPASLDTAMRCANRYAKTLVVVAHP